MKAKPHEQFVQELKLIQPDLEVLSIYKCMSKKLL